MERRRLLICTTLIFGLAACGGGGSSGGSGDNGGGGNADAGDGTAGNPDGGGSATDKPEIIVSGDLSTTLNESSRDGSAITSRELQVKLSAAPAAAVQVSIKASVADKLKFEPASLTLSDTAPKTVKVTVLADEDTTDDTVKISAEASGYGSYGATVKIVDKTITIDPIAAVTLGAGSVDFSVKPSAPGTITVTRPNTEAGNSILLQDEADHVRTLEFTDTEAQDVTVNPADTGLSGEIPLTVAGAYLFPVTVTVDYTAQQAILVYAASTGGDPLASISLREGEERIVYVQLATAPEVGMELSGSVPSGAPLTVSNVLEFHDDDWNTRQSLALSPNYDDGNLEDDNTTLTIDGDASDPSLELPVTVTDLEIELRILAGSLALQEGGPGQEVCFERSLPAGNSGPATVYLAWGRSGIFRIATSLFASKLNIPAISFEDGANRACVVITATDEFEHNAEHSSTPDLEFGLSMDHHTYAHGILAHVTIQDDEAAEVDEVLTTHGSAFGDGTPYGQLTYNTHHSQSPLGMAVLQGSDLWWIDFDIDGVVDDSYPHLYDGQSQVSAVDDGVLAAYSVDDNKYYLYHDADSWLDELQMSPFTPQPHIPMKGTTFDGAIAEDGATLWGSHRTTMINGHPVILGGLTFNTPDRQGSVSIYNSPADQMQLVRTAAGSYTAVWLNGGTPYCRQVTLNAGTPEAAGDAAVDLGSDLATSIDALAASASTGGEVVVVYKTEASHRYSFVKLDADCTNVRSGSPVGGVNKSAPKLYFNGAEHRLLTETAGQLDVYDMTNATPAWSSPNSSCAQGAMIWARDRWVLRYRDGDESQLMITTGAF